MVPPPSEALALEFSGDAPLHLDYHLPELFRSIATNRDYRVDGKSLADAEPTMALGQIIAAHTMESQNPDFDPLAFWGQHFKLPDYTTSNITTSEQLPIDEYISSMWPQLTYHVPISRGTLIGTRYPTLKPGQRFVEACYWDLGFGVSGLLAEARTDSDAERRKKENLALGIANNMADMIYQYRYVPNGQRTYYLGRSQPPVFARMVKEMANHFGDRYPNLIEDHLPAVVREYNWWMEGESAVKSKNGLVAHERVVRMSDGSVLNRHWDSNNTPNLGSTPRWESFREDIETASRAPRKDPRIIFRHLRAGAETGKDFTARYMTDPERLETIHTTDFITPELNSLLYEYETLIADAYKTSGRSKLAEEFAERATQRKAAINKYLWNDARGCYYDYDFVKDEQSEIQSAGMAYPVSCGIASPDQAKRVAAVLRQPNMLKIGGFVSADIESNEHWDKPNGWSPDQLVINDALIVAGDYPTAALAIQRWLQRNNDVYNRFGVLMEKNNVVDAEALPGGGGEYPVQWGFLWTNGVHRVFQARLREDSRLKPYI